MSLDLIKEFETAQLAEFHHQDHIHLAWLYLQKYDLWTALGRFCASLKHLATAHGQAVRYNETMTGASMCIIHERMVKGSVITWAEFAQHNPDLFQWPATILHQYYSAETLASPLAKQTFLFPDQVGTKTSANLDTNNNG